MTSRYMVAYLSWCAGVLTMTVAAFAWYRHVEGIGLSELAARMRATEATEATETPDG